MSRYYKEIKNGDGTNLIIGPDSRYISIGKNGEDIMIGCNGKCIAFDSFEQMFDALSISKSTYYKDSNPETAYVYEMNIPVFGRYEAVVHSDEQLTEQEVLERAFDEGNFGELKDCDTDIDLAVVYKSGDFLEKHDERDEI